MFEKCELCGLLVEFTNDRKCPKCGHCHLIVKKKRNKRNIFRGEK